MYTGQLTDQHQKLWTLIHAMENSSPADAAGTARTVAQLSGILSIHLAAEDKYLYPSLKNSPDDKIRAVAIRYEKEMGHLAATILPIAINTAPPRGLKRILPASPVKPAASCRPFRSV